MCFKRGLKGHADLTKGRLKCLLVLYDFGRIDNANRWCNPFGNKLNPACASQ